MPDFHPPLGRDVGATLKWCYQPHPLAELADFGNVDGWLEDRIRRMADRIDYLASQQRYGDVALIAADLADHARAAAALKLHIARKRAQVAHR